MRQVSWRADVDTAFSEAKAQKKLVFVLFRCQRERRDTELLQPTNSRLVALLTERYIPVRLISLKGVDLNRFRFDYDRQLTGLVLTPEGATLARWGDEDVSVNSLVALLEQLISVPWPQALVVAPQTLSQRFPAFAQSKRADEACYHCHYAFDAEIEQQRQAGTFRKNMLFRYPLPDVLGLILDDGNRIKAVRPGSPADRRGLKVGERLTQVEQTPIYTASDVAAALDPLPESPTRVLLNGKPAALGPGWRRYDISWRASQGAIPPIFGFWEEQVPGSKTLALKVNFVFPGPKWAPSLGGLKLGDVIVAVDRKTLPQMTPRQFHTWLRLNKEVGQKLKLTVLRDGRRLTLTLLCLDLRLD